MISGYVAIYLAWLGKWDDALSASERLVQEYPLFVVTHHARGMTLFYAGQHAEAASAFEKAIRMSPNNPENYQFQTLLAFALYCLEHYDAALSWAEEALRAVPIFAQALGIRAAALGQMGQPDATEAAVRFLDTFPNSTASGHCRNFRWRNPKDVNHYAEGLIKAGLPE